MTNYAVFLLRFFLGGIAFTFGVLFTGLAAVTISGTIHTFQTGEVLSASKINENFISIKATIEGINDAPVGTILAWHKNFAGTPALPDGWVECDGSVISDTASVYNGQTLPNLNGTARFLRGSSTSGTLQAATWHIHDHIRTDASTFMMNRGDPTGTGQIPQNVDSYQGIAPPPAGTWLSVNGTIGGGLGELPYYTSRPVNMTVVWIIKIK